MCNSQSSKAFELAAAYLQVKKGTKAANNNKFNYSALFSLWIFFRTEIPLLPFYLDNQFEKTVIKI